MKKNLRNNWGMYLVVLLATLTSCGHDGDHAENADTYTCPMHPTVVSDRPGSCPVCGMDLVRKTRAGEEVAQLYIRDRVASITRPIRELKGFQKFKLEPGQSREVRFELTRHDLEFVGLDNQWISEPGEFDVWIAPSSVTGTSARFTLQR